MSDELLLQLADLIGRQVAERVRVELGDVVGGAAVEEPWRLLTLEEACARLGRGDRWVRERVKRGELPHVRLDGGALAFELADLQAFAAARRVGGDVLAVRLQDVRERSAGAALPREPQPPRLRR